MNLDDLLFLRLKKRHIQKFIGALVSFALLFSSVGVLSLPSSAWADIRRTDLIQGVTVDQRGLDVTACPSIDAEYAYVVGSDGEVYFARNAQEQTQIASITKIMTAIIALEHASLDTQVVVSQRAAEVGESSANLIAGDILAMSEALKGLMIPSGNDAAVAIAECVGQILLGNTGASNEAAYDAFVGAMNTKAQELGCTNTVFTNPHGLDFDEFEGELASCAEEVSKIAAFAMNNSVFRQIVAMESADLEVVRNGQRIEITVVSTDALLGSYEGACGIKTGNTDLAGPCLASACNRNGQDLYAIVLHSTSESQRFSDAITLFDWVYSNQIQYKLANSSESMVETIDGVQREVPVVARVALDDWIDKTAAVTFEDPDATVEIFVPNGNVSQEFYFDTVGSVSVGDVVGHATFFQQGEAITEINLVACEDVPAPGILERVGIWWDKLMRGFSGQAQCAESVIINDTPLVMVRS